MVCLTAVPTSAFYLNIKLYSMRVTMYYNLITQTVLTSNPEMRYDSSLKIYNNFMKALAIYNFYSMFFV